MIILLNVNNAYIIYYTSCRQYESINSNKTSKHKYNIDNNSIATIRFVIETHYYKTNKSSQNLYPNRVPKSKKRTD